MKRPGTWASPVLILLALAAGGERPAHAQEGDFYRFGTQNPRGPAASSQRRSVTRQAPADRERAPRYGGQAYRPAPPSTPTLYYGPGGYYYVQPAPREAYRAPPPPREVPPREVLPREVRPPVSREAYRGQPVPAPAPAPQQDPFWFFRRQPAQPVPPPAVVEPRRERPAVARPRPRPVPAQPRAPEQEEPEVEPSISFAVFGDSLAAPVMTGLDEAFEDNLDVVVEDRTRGDTGLVRLDVYDWPKAIQDYLAAHPKLSAGVVMLGINDRQPIREGETTHEPLSDRWRELYRARVDAIVKAFADRKIPLIWIGTPPLRNERASADMIALNELYRDRVQRAGGIYVDIWEAFVDEANRYAQSGPDLGGETTRLRAADGIHFTRAGGRKAAHFADVEIKRMMEARLIVPAQPDAPAAGDRPAPPEVAKEAGPKSIDQIIDASLPDLPQPPGVAGLAARPVAGPVVPLNRLETSPGGTLVARRIRPGGDAAFTAEQALNQGLPPAPRRGRADDFTWPPPNE